MLYASEWVLLTNELDVFLEIVEMFPPYNALRYLFDGPFYRQGVPRRDCQSLEVC